MKTFHHARGHEAGQTMTVEELILKLAQYPHDMPVFGGWERVYGYIRPENFDVERVHKGDTKDECDCLVIDVESY